MMFNIVDSIDYETLIAIKGEPITIMGVYAHALHLKVNDVLLTLGFNIGSSKHHINLTSNVDFKSLNIDSDSSVIISLENIMIDHYICLINQNSFMHYTPFNQIFQTSKKTLELIDDVKSYLKNNHSKNLFHFDQNNPIDTFLFDRIDSFLSNPNIVTAKNILGLGEGLTPLGDDIILGYVMGKLVIDQVPDWFDDVLLAAKKQTTYLSYQNLIDIYHRFYAEPFIEMIKGFFETYYLNSITDVAKIGHTSGAGIITGFIHAII